MTFNIRHSLLSFVGLLTLSACAAGSNSDQLAQSIQQEIIKQGGLSLRSVTCPKDIRLDETETFECLGEIDTGYTFTIPVKQQGNSDQVVWDVPHAKGLLNLAKFESALQEAMASEVGSRPVIRCGNTLYKAVKPGQSFECQIDVKPIKPAQATRSTPDKTATTAKMKTPAAGKIVVSVDTDSNVTWQRVLPGVVATNTIATQPTSASTPATDSPASEQKTANDRPAATSPPPATQPNAEDFLNQPNASQGFED